ncbi:MAG: hypothetical protein KJ799_00105 [Bacteroidetes bacterium]|nr:hypothetical protein [Bacteroidota bacterium]MBU1680936.1 hypothetical protein [Bacteroidota bacterium]MBU2505125.1 hypothetical protein [Bacteroidota bacterium]
MKKWNHSKGDYDRKNETEEWEKLKFSWKKRALLEFGLIVVSLVMIVSIFLLIN